MATKRRPKFLRFRRRPVELPGDPFAGTKLDYAFNLLQAKVCNRYHDLRESELVVRLIELAGKLRRPSGRKIEVADIAVDVFNRLVRSVVTASGGELRVPRAAEAPLANNLDLLADVLSLSEAERDVLQFSLACRERDMRALLDPIPCHSRCELTAIVSAAIARRRTSSCNSSRCLRA